MNINDMTIGEFKELSKLFTGAGCSTGDHPFKGKYVVARCYAAGVHAGEVVSVDGDNVILKDSRRLWNWKAKDGLALSGVAQHGLQSSGSKLDVVNPEIYLSGVAELIPCAKGVKENINDYK